MNRGPIALGAAAIASAACLVAAVPAGAVPSVFLEGPVAGCCVNQKRPAITGVVSGGVAASEVTVQVFQGPVVDETPELTLTATPDGSGRYGVAPPGDLADGPWTARASQSDVTGVGTSESLTFIVDTVGPLPAITGPVDGSAVPTSTPTITGRAGTAEGDAAMVILIVNGPGGERRVQAAVDAAGDFRIDAPPLPDGNYGMTVIQSDVAGNGGSSVESGFTVDTRAPKAVIVTGPVPVAGGTRNVKVEFGADEAATFRCELDGATYATPCRSPLLLRGLAAGRHRLTVVASDSAGNEDTTAPTLAFAIDVAPPRIAVSPRMLVSRAGEPSFRLSCPTTQAGGPCVGQFAIRRNGRALLVKPVRFNIKPGKAVRVPLRLNGAGQDLLFRNGRIRVQIVIVAADGRGNVGRKTVRRTLTIPR